MAQRKYMHELQRKLSTLRRGRRRKALSEKLTVNKKVGEGTECILGVPFSMRWLLRRAGYEFF